VKLFPICLLAAVQSTALVAQPANPAPLVAQQAAPVRLVFGMISGNRGFVRGAFASEAKGSVLNATAREPQTETRDGPDAIADLVATLPSLTGVIRNGRCKPGEPGKLACDFEIARRHRQLQAVLDVKENLITSVIFAVTSDR
jgi:hypothetical protein